MDKKKRNKIWLITFMFVFVLSILFFINLRSQRTHNKWIVEFKLANNDLISVLLDHNYKKIFSFLKGPLEIWRIGGDDCKYNLYFNYKMKGYEFNLKGEPFLLNIWGNNFYLVTLLDEGESKTESKRKFKFFKYTNNWIEIAAESFPKEIAFANLYFSINYPYHENFENMNRKHKNIANSLTLRLWLKLLKGIDFYQKGKMDQNLVLDFKKRYIDPFWGKRNFEEYLPKVKKYEPNK